MLKGAVLLLVISSISLCLELRIATNEEAPTNYLNSEKELVGISVDVVNELRRIIGVEEEIGVYPWARAYMYAKRDSNVVVFTCGKSSERIEDGFHFIGPLTTRKQILWAKKGRDLKLKSLDDIKFQGLTIGVMREDWREQFFEDRGFMVEDVTLHSTNINKLLYGRVDLWAISDLEASSIVKLTGNTMEAIEPAFTYNHKADSYIMLSRDIPENVLIEWRTAFSLLYQNGFMNKVAKRWSEKLDITIKYSRELGFHINEN